MSWRDRLSKPSQELGDRPTLEGVLDHYGIEYSHRTAAMVHCPLHEDNTKSCSINTDKQLWKCHSCNNGGDAWELIKRKEGLDFDGARRLAASLGLTAGGPGGGDQQLRGRTGQRRSGGAVPRRSGSNTGDGGYVPSWRRSKS